MNNEISRWLLNVNRKLTNEEKSVTYEVLNMKMKNLEQLYKKVLKGEYTNKNIQTKIKKLLREISILTQEIRKYNKTIFSIYENENEKIKKFLRQMYE
jgi:hypothetical protein